MNHFRINIPALCILTATFAQAQIKKVSEEDAALAESLKALYKDAGDAVWSSHETYTFEWDAKADPRVTGRLWTEETILALKDGHTMQKAVFYDDMSEVTKPRAYNEKGKNIGIYPYYGPYQSGEFFYDDAQVCTFKLYFDTRGQKIRYNYYKKYKDLKYLTSVYFHDFRPVLQKKVEFVIPDWLEIELKEFNFDGFPVQKSTSRDEKQQTTTHTYTISELPPLKNERNAPSFSKNFPHILVLSKGYDKDGEDGKLLAGTEDLYRWYHSLVESMSNKTEELATTVKILTEGKKTDTEKIEAIFYWVQDNIRYIAFEDGIMGFKPANAQDVYHNRYGDCKGMANLTKEMLKLSGFDARLTWIGTNDIPYDYSIPSLAVDNHMICTVFLEGKKYYLDATEEYIGFNDYASRIQGRPVLIENGAEFILDKVPEYPKENNTIAYRITMDLQEPELNGKYHVVYNGEEKTVIRRSYSSLKSDKKEDAIKEFLNDGNKNLQITNIVTSDLEERTGPLDFKYDFKLRNQVTNIGNEYYVTIDFNRKYGNSKFEEDRENDWEFRNKVHIEGHQELNIPADWTVDYLPEPIDIKNDFFSFSLKYGKEGNKVIYTKTISIDKALLPKSNFKAWNEAVEKVAKFYGSQIVLRKP